MAKERNEWRWPADLLQCEQVARSMNNRKKNKSQYRSTRRVSEYGGLKNGFTQYWVVLENNNGHVTQLSAEEAPLLRALLASLREEVLAFFPGIGPEELESANV
jgi:hypothetical protein